MVFSADGTSMALQTPDAVVFYAVDAEPGAWSVGPGARVDRNGDVDVGAVAVGSAAAVTIAGVSMLALVAVD